MTYLDTYREWKTSLSGSEQWGHCGDASHHTAHTHTIYHNEGAYHNVPCIGTPVFDVKWTLEDPPTLEERVD